MGLIQERINIKVNNFTENHFKSIGYDVKNGSLIEIPVHDLPNGSGLKVDVMCEYCNKIFKKSWRRYLETQDDICCDDCKKHKMTKTTLDKFGMSCSIHHPNVKAKMLANNINKYGVAKEYYKSEDTIAKTKKTMIERYGVPYPALNPDILKKMNRTMQNKSGSTLFISKNQKKLHDIYGGVLNFCFEGYFIDIFDIENNIAIEYDGGGHDLRVKKGSCTRDEFQLSERKREQFFVDHGFKILRIVDSFDKFESIETLLSIRNIAIECFLSSDDNIYIYNIETKSKTSFRI